MTRKRDWRAKANGMAGDPPPDPRSMRWGEDGRAEAAAMGSSSSRSKASSGFVNEVRLIFRFQRSSSS